VSTETICLRFSSARERVRQLKIFSEVTPELLMEPVGFLQDQTESVFIDSKPFQESQAASFLLENTVAGKSSDGLLHFPNQEEQPIPEDTGEQLPLWALLPFENMNQKQPVYYSWFPMRFFERITRDCLAMGLFDLSYLHYESSQQNQVLFQIPSAPRVLLLRIEEEYGGRSFWKDPFELFYPLGQIHPMSRWWSSSLGPSLVFERGIHSLEKLEFQPVLNSVRFEIPPSSKSPPASEELPEVEIEIKLKPAPSKRTEPAQLWYYTPEDKPSLENWLTHLSISQHQAYLLYPIQDPIQGFFLKKSGGIKKGAVPPPVSRESFYKPFKGEEFYIPVSQELSPRLPREKLLELSPFGREEGLVFFQGKKGLQPLRLQFTKFQPLTELIFYLLEESVDLVFQTTKGISLQDSNILIEEISQEIYQRNQPSEEKQEREKILSPQPTRQRINTNQSAEQEQEESEQFSLERFQTHQGRAQLITQLRDWLVNNPYSHDPEPWKRLGTLEMDGENYQEGGRLLEFALSFTQEPAKQRQLARAILNCQLRGVGVKSKIRNLEEIPPENLSTEDLCILSLYLIKESTRLRQDYLSEFTRKYLPVLESREQEIPILLYWNLSLCLHECLQPGTYFLFRSRDRILYRLISEGLFSPESLPGLLSTTGYDQSACTDEFHERYLKLIQVLGNHRETNDGDWIVFHLVFAAGYALRKSGDRMQENLETAWEKVSKTMHPFHQALYETYSQRAQELLEGRGVSSHTSELRILDTLSRTHRYFHSTLLRESLLFEQSPAHEFDRYDQPGFQQRSEEDLRDRVIPQALRTLRTAMPGIHDYHYDRARTFHSILNVLPKIGEQAVFELYPELYSQFLPSFRSVDRGGIVARMLILADQFERADWIRTLSSEFLDAVEGALLGKPGDLLQILEPALDILPRLLNGTLSREIAAKLEQKTLILEEYPKLRTILSRLLDFQERGDAIQELMDQILQAYFQTPHPHKVDLLKFILRNWAQTSQEFQTLVRGRIQANFHQFEDHLSLNEALSLSKLLVFEFFVIHPTTTGSLTREGRNLLYTMEHSWKQRISEIFQEIQEEPP